MNLNTTVLRGEVGGRRAEVRVEELGVRVQALSVVSQQPALDVFATFADLKECRLVSKPQWGLGVAFLAVGLFLAYGSGGAIPEARLGILLLFTVIAAATIAMGFLFPLITLQLADTEHRVAVRVPRFSKRRAIALVQAVQSRVPPLAEPAA